MNFDTISEKLKETQNKVAVVGKILLELEALTEELFIGIDTITSCPECGARLKKGDFDDPLAK